MDTTVDSGDAAGESKAERRLRKQAEKAAESQPLEPWERYRALSDQLDHMLDVVEMADRRTRFALVLLGTLNAANALIAVQAQVLGATALNAVILRGYVACYLLLSMYFLVQAVNALRPRSRQLGKAGDNVADTSGLPRIRLIDDILTHQPDEFYDVWRTASIGAVNRELALQVYLLARTAAVKYAALVRVYNGVLLLLALTTLFVLILALHAIAPSIV